MFHSLEVNLLTLNSEPSHIFYKKGMCTFICNYEHYEKDRTTSGQGEQQWRAKMKSLASIGFSLSANQFISNWPVHLWRSTPDTIIG